MQNGHKEINKIANQKTYGVVADKYLASVALIIKMKKVLSRAVISNCTPCDLPDQILNAPKTLRMLPAALVPPLPSPWGKHCRPFDTPRKS